MIDITKLSATEFAWLVVAVENRLEEQRNAFAEYVIELFSGEQNNRRDEYLHMGLHPCRHCGNKMCPNSNDCWNCDNMFSSSYRGVYWRNRSWKRHRKTQYR